MNKSRIPSCGVRDSCFYLLQMLLESYAYFAREFAVVAVVGSKVAVMNVCYAWLEPEVLVELDIWSYRIDRTEGRC